MINIDKSMTCESNGGPKRSRTSTQDLGVKTGVKLTDASIKGLGRRAQREGLRELKMRDETTRGLLLVAKDTGRLEWRYRFNQHGKDRVTVLGRYPTMTLTKAREEAEKARQRVEMGEDIRETKRAALQPFSHFLDRFYDRWKIGKREGSIATTSPRVKLLKEKLGLVPVSMLTTGKIAAALDSLPETTANRCLHICQQSLRIAKVHGAVAMNEARELKASDLNSKPKVKTPRTCAKLADVMPSIEKVAERSLVAADALRVVALTAMRIEETVSLEWRDLDFNAKVLNVRAENRKGRLDVRHPLVVPLSDHAVAVLREVASRKSSDRWIFAGNLGGHIDRRSVLHNLKLVAPVATVHGFRSLFSTVANDSGGFDGDVIEVALGHRLRGVKGVYDKGKRLEQRRALMQWWGNRVMGDNSNLLTFPNSGAA